MPLPDKRPTGASLEGLMRFDPHNPPEGLDVIWIWDSAGQLTAGDCFNGRPRDAAKNYQEILPEDYPTHYTRWPDNWPM